MEMLDNVLPQVADIAEESSSVVAGNSLLTFFSGVSREDERFIKDSMRWAEYQAVQRVNRRQAPGFWFEYYSASLQQLGWELGEPVRVAGREFEGDFLDAWSKSMERLLSSGRRQQMKKTFQLLEHNPAGFDLFADSVREWNDFVFSPAYYNYYKHLEIVISHVGLLDAQWTKRYLFWDVEYSRSQLEVYARRFMNTPKNMNARRAELTELVRDMRRNEFALSQ
ncbi:MULTISPECIES: hypothetical protein [unclassified Pseudomonas]|uniref:hypothetical protein n=1 Tax=unclassified Pseudomonas TaxID=196821 RepID=UPI000A1DDED6|nr:MULTISPECIES: hypothetical protein [unclassified Pseudomonas]NKF29068.1 hypothetical protein [Pseudomonas sp. BG5]